MHLGLRAGHKLTAEVCQQAQMLLNEGLERPRLADGWDSGKHSALGIQNFSEKPTHSGATAHSASQSNQSLPRERAARLRGTIKDYARPTRGSCHPLLALQLSESGIFTRSHSPKATSSPISVALLIARGLSGSTERMNVRVRSLYPKADCRPGTES
jgi:hypothetical protein